MYIPSLPTYTHIHIALHLLKKSTCGFMSVVHQSTYQNPNLESNSQYHFFFFLPLLNKLIPVFVEGNVKCISHIHLTLICSPLTLITCFEFLWDLISRDSIHCNIISSFLLFPFVLLNITLHLSFGETEAPRRNLRLKPRIVTYNYRDEHAT